MTNPRVHKEVAEPDFKNRSVWLWHQVEVTLHHTTKWVMAPQRGRSHQQGAQLGMNNQLCKLLLSLPQFVPTVHMSNLMGVGVLSEPSAKSEEARASLKGYCQCRPTWERNECMFSHWTGASQQQTHFGVVNLPLVSRATQASQNNGIGGVSRDSEGQEFGEWRLPPGESGLWAEEIASSSGTKSVYEFLRQRE